MSTGIPFAHPQRLPDHIHSHGSAGTIMSLLLKRGMTYQTHPRTAKFCEAYLDQFPFQEHKLVNILGSLSRGWSALESYRMQHPQVDTQPSEPSEEPSNKPSNEPSEDLRKAIEAVDAQENTSLPATTRQTLFAQVIELITGVPMGDLSVDVDLNYTIEANGVRYPTGKDFARVQMDVNYDGTSAKVDIMITVHANGVNQQDVREHLLPGII